MENELNSPEDIIVQRYFDNLNEGILIDVGAHLGRYTSFFAAKGWKCYSFEPEIRNFIKLKKNCQYFKNVKLFNLAITHLKAKKIDFYVSDKHWGIHSIKPWHSTHKLAYKVNCIRLDKFCEREGINSVNFLKIDTEGADFDVVKSINVTKIQPDVIMVEFVDSRTIPFSNYSYQDIADYLFQFGYIGFLAGFSEIKSPSIEGRKDELVRYNQICKLGEEKKEKSWGGNIIFYKKNDGRFEYIIDNFMRNDINRYINIECFRGIYKNKRCFIICNGPSINKLDLTKMKNEITFGCNRIYLNYDKTGFHTTYYFSVDTIMAIAIRKESLEYLKNPDVKAGFFLKHHERYINGDKCYYLGGKDSELWSVGMAMIRMAILMGCNPIYVIGLDLDYNYPDKENRINYKKIEDLHFDKETKEILLNLKQYVNMKGVFTLKDGMDDKSHFGKDYLTNVPAHFVTRSEAISAYEEMAKKMSDEDKSKIYNAGIGGNCEIFKRIDYSTLF